LILLVISVLVIRLAAGRRYLFTGWFWYLGTLVPVIGFVQVGAQAMADRYSYIPLTGLFIIIAWSLPELLGKWSYRKMVLWTSSLIVLFILTALTYLQLQYWRDSITLYQHALAVTKNNYTINFSITQPLLDQGRNEEAVLHCSEALRIIPDDLSAQIGLTGALLAAGRLDQVEIECQKFLQKEPNDPDLLNNLGIAFGRQGKFDQAVKYLTKALQIKPDFADAHTNIGYVLTIQSNLDEAAVHLYKALQLDPDSALAHYYFGNILVQSGKINEAVTHFEKALKLKPDWVELMNSLAWILAVQPEMTSHNPDKAVKLAQRACELTNYQEPELLDTLSVAYAAAGDFNKAVEIAQKALELCQSGEKKILKKEIEKRLVLYKENKPYIEAAK